ncbi:MAG TPA: DUF167 domain-containing protein [Candidatus Dojkabacteria bacterium]|nr:DUF167 domain-containing protein [Candidatus Dojkabacteria bacterium]HQG57406.1 DUF167 domain-containing protein [Candidatus Dojkabacteria bacterium]
MIISVIAKTKSKSNKVVPVSDSGYTGKSFIVYTKEGPIDNRANIDIIKQLAKYYGIAKSNIKIKSGLSSKNKLFIIDIEE